MKAVTWNGKNDNGRCSKLLTSANGTGDAPRPDLAVAMEGDVRQGLRRYIGIRHTARQLTPLNCAGSGS
jgi:hypothetical protein